MAKKYNPNLVKINRSYTIEEAANIFTVHKNTVRAWIKDGLPACDNRKPWLILGYELKEFLKIKNRHNKKKCKPHEIYCLSCRTSKKPAAGMVDYESMSATTGQLKGLCPTCEHIINKYISLASLEQIKSKLEITYKTKQKHINKRNALLLNSDLNK